MATPWNLRNRPFSTEMGDQFNQTEMNNQLRRPTWLDDDADWQNPFGQDYDPNDLYGNLDMTPGFTGGAGEGASNVWQDYDPEYTGTNGGNNGNNGGEEEEDNGITDDEIYPTFDKSWSDYDPSALGTETAYPDSPQYQGPDRPDVDDFQYDAWQAPDAFKAPTMQEAQAAPGFQMMMDQGRKALEASAAAKGMSRSGQQHADLMDYGQKMGARGYQDVYQRRAGEHQQRGRELERDYKTGYGAARDMYDVGRENQLGAYGLERQESRDQFAPKMAQYGMDRRSAQQDREFQRKKAWQEYRIDEDRFDRDDARKRAWAYSQAHGTPPPNPSAFRSRI